MLLSLVVIFTQSIQLSKIVCGNLRYSYEPLRLAGDIRRSDMLKDQSLLSQKLNLDQVAY